LPKVSLADSVELYLLVGIFHDGFFDELLVLKADTTYQSNYM